MKKFLQYVHPGVQINFRFSSLLIKLCRSWDGKFEVDGKIYPLISFTREHKEIQEDQDTLYPRVRHIDGWTLTLPYVYVLFLCATKDVVHVPDAATVLGFWTFQNQQKQYVKAKEPLVLHIERDDSDRYFVISDARFGIDIIAENNPIEAIETELDFLWQAYALCPDEDLDNEAQVIKKNLLERFQ